MNEFDDQNVNGYQSGADYYRQSANPEPGAENTTYHYSYQAQGNATQHNNYYNPNQQSYYQPPQGEPQQQYSNNPEPPKKSKAGKVIIIIFVICIVIAGIGLAAGALSKGTDNTPSKENTSQSQDSPSDVQTAESGEVAQKDSEGNLTVAGVAAKCMDSCVGITVYSKQVSAYEYFYGYGTPNNNNNEPSLSGEGSGVLLSESNGKTYIITCAHVIDGGDSFKVTTNDRKEYDATIVALDSQTDIGVLSIEKTGLAIAEFANSEKGLVVGEQVVAIGCPGGLEFMNSTTSGYISALDRPVSSSIGYSNKCIQHDAAINPGNSGGALFNMQGQVVGINSSKIASTEYEGMGFAVPSSTAVATANSLIRAGYVEGRARLGIEYNPITSFSNSQAIINALADKGYKDAMGIMVIRAVSEDSDLNGKVQQYDMIVAIDGEVLTSTDVMISKLAASKPGDKVKLTIARITNNEITTQDIDCTLLESKG